jgi:diguanylate cyclase (GGDEF)-like protein/PAS domain S-box-containing protein
MRWLARFLRNSRCSDPLAGVCSILDSARRTAMVHLSGSMKISTARHPPDETLDCIGDAVVSTDLDGLVTYLNPAAEVLTGWSRAAAAGQPFGRVLHIVDRETRIIARDPMALAVGLDKTVGLTPNCVLIRRDGEERPIEDSAAPIRNREGSVIGAVMVFRDVGAALQTSRRMAHLAQHDPLTGLLNRLPLAHRLTEALALAERHARPLAVLFADVDGFKHLNDSLGHAAGDQVLCEMGARFQAALRRSDTVCRFGGDEFVVVLAEIAREEDAALVAEKVQRAIAEPYRVGSVEASLTVSIGISLFPRHGAEAGALIAQADDAMYLAKAAGAGTFGVFDAGTASQMSDPQGARLNARRATAHSEGKGADLALGHAAGL